MKKLLLLFLSFSFTLFSQQQKNSIESNTIKESKEVVQETTDSDSVVSDNTTKIEIVNIPEDSWWDIYSPYISVLFGVVIGWVLSHYSQKRLIKTQLLYSSKENWLREFMDTSSEFLAAEYISRNAAVKIIEATLKESGKGTSILEEKYMPNLDKLIKSGQKFENSLDASNRDEKIVLDSFKDYMNIIMDLTQGNFKPEEFQIKAHESILKISKEISELISVKRKELIL